MKLTYERPCVTIEAYVANQAIATCTVSGGITYTFDCMYGPQVDTFNCISKSISDGCNTDIGYAEGITTARDYSSRGRHSNNNPSMATWTTGSNYLQVTYSGKVDGLLYTDGSIHNITCWSITTDGIVQHSSDSGGTHHMVAPVVDSYSINASW